MRTLPDFASVHQELKRPGVTLMLLWMEYRKSQPEGYGYARFCELYQRWRAKLKRSMRQVHRAGEKTFVDFAGRKPHLVDPETGDDSFHRTVRQDNQPDDKIRIEVIQASVRDDTRDPAGHSPGANFQDRPFATRTARSRWLERPNTATSSFFDSCSLERSSKTGLRHKDGRDGYRCGQRNFDFLSGLHWRSGRARLRGRNPDAPMARR